MNASFAGRILFGRGVFGECSEFIPQALGARGSDVVFHPGRQWRAGWQDEAFAFVGFSRESFAHAFNIAEAPNILFGASLLSLAIFSVGRRPRIRLWSLAANLRR